MYTYFCRFLYNFFSVLWYYSGFSSLQLLGNCCRFLFIASLPSPYTLTLYDACSYSSWKGMYNVWNFSLHSGSSIRKSFFYQNIPLKLSHPEGDWEYICKHKRQTIRLSPKDQVIQSSCKLSKGKSQWFKNLYEINFMSLSLWKLHNRALFVYLISLSHFSDHQTHLLT